MNEKNTNSSPSKSLSAILLFSGRLSNGILTIAAGAALSWLWSRQEYGTYREVWLVFLTLNPFLSLGIPASITYFVPQYDKARQKSLVIQTIILLMTCGLAAGLLPVFFGPAISKWFHNEKLKDLFLLFAFYPLFSFPLLIVDTWLLALRRPSEAAIFNLWTAVLHVGTTVLPVALGYDIKAVFFFLTAGVFIRFLSFAYLYRREYLTTKLNWDWSITSSQLRYAIPLAASAIISAFILLLDRLIIASWYDTENFAIYYNGAKELPVVGIITGSIVSVIAPEFVRLYNRNNYPEIVRLWQSSIRKTAFILFPLSAFLFCFAEDVVTLLFSDKYAASVPIFRIYLLLLPLRITSYGAVLRAANQTRIIFVSACLALLLNLIFSLSLVYLIGMPGAAIGTVLAVYVTNGIQLVWATRVLGTTIRNIFPWSNLFTLGLISACAACLATYFTQSMNTGIVHITAGFTLFSLTAFLLNLGYPQSRHEMYSVYSAVKNSRNGSP